MLLLAPTPREASEADAEKRERGGFGDKKAYRTAVCAECGDQYVAIPSSPSCRVGGADRVVVVED